MYLLLYKFSIKGDSIFLKSCELGFILDKKEKLISIEEFRLSPTESNDDSSDESEEEQFKIVYEEDETSPA